MKVITKSRCDGELYSKKKCQKCFDFMRVMALKLLHYLPLAIRSCIKHTTVYREIEKYVSTERGI